MRQEKIDENKKRKYRKKIEKIEIILSAKKSYKITKTLINMSFVKLCFTYDICQTALKF